MAHCEVELDSNIMDVAFSRSGARIAVLTTDSFSIFTWPTDARPLPPPLLESSHPLVQSSQNHARQIGFLHESEVFTLVHYGASECRIERMRLATRESSVVYVAEADEQIQSIFPSISHDKLWISRSSQQKKGTAYLTGILSSEKMEFSSFEMTPAVETQWAASTLTSDKQVFLHTVDVFISSTDLSRMYFSL